MRTTVTNIEAFRMFRDDEWMSFDDLMERFTGSETQNVMMAASHAFHSILQKASAGEFTTMQFGRFKFDLSRITAEIALTPLRELRLSKHYVIDGVDLEVRGRVDGSDGVAVDEHKIKYGSFDAERYGDSLQWRLYLDMSGHQLVRYNVFQGPGSDTVAMRSLEQAWQLCPCIEYIEEAEPADIPKCVACGFQSILHGIIGVELTALHQLTLYTYPTLHDDVIGLLSDYVAFARRYLTDDAIVAWREEQNRKHAHIDPGK